ncbi:GMC oxidoreductase [Mycena crocata]|nr:GMC oxidoreductase [Mycena crocata]
MPYPTRSIRDISKTYAYIVVGGGTLGCVLAARLSEDPRTTVLLIERGPVVDVWTSGVPVISSNITDENAPIYKWQSAPLKALDGKTFLLNRWESSWGHIKSRRALGWAWNDVEPYFKISETHSNAATYHGSKGPWKTRGSDDVHFEYVARFSRAWVSPISTRLTILHPPSSAALFSMLLSTATAVEALLRTLFSPKRSLKLGEISTSASDQKAVGVYLQSITGGTSRRVSVDREVIMCAGAIFTPQILLTSGIGPADHLKEHGIRENIFQALAPIYKTISVSLSSTKVPLADSLDVLLQSPLTVVWQLLKYLFTGKGLLGSLTQQTSITLRSSLLDDNSHTIAADAEKDLNGDDSLNIPNLEIMLLPVNPSGTRAPQLGKSDGSFTYICTLLRPKSAGSRRGPPPALQGLQMVLALGRAVRADGYPLHDLSVPVSESEEDLDAFTNAHVGTTYHNSSTCRMAEETQMGVVGDRLRVHVAGLRNADASIFPEISACHLQAPVVMVAERCAAYLSGDHGL